MADWRVMGFLLATFALAGPVIVQAGPADTDWPDRPYSKSSGQFAVVQTATIDADQFLAEWRKPTPGVNLNVTTHTRRNRPIFTFILFRGCRADPTGKCDVTVTYDVSGPSGKRYDHKTMDVWAKQPQPLKGITQLSRQGYGLVFDGKDKPGGYLVRAAVTDHVAGITVHTQQALTVSE